MPSFLRLLAFTSLASLAACATGTSGDSSSESSSLTSAEALDQAEQEIAAAHYSAAAVLLKQALLGGGDETRALSLVDRIYDLTNGATIPVEDGLPARFHGMKLMIDRYLRRPDEVGSQPGDHVMSISLSAPFSIRDEVTALKIVKEPTHEVLLDGSDASQWGLGINRDDPKSFLTKVLPDGFSGSRLNGLYSMSITLNDAARTQLSSWFIVTRALAPDDPTIDAPTNVPLTEGRDSAAHSPADAELAFQDFRSSLYKPYERRNLVAILRYHQFIGDNRLTSSYWKREFPNPDLGHLQAGVDGIPLLMSGEYRFALDYQEIKSFGSFDISRGSQTIVRFFADPDPVTSCETISDADTCRQSQSVDRGVCVWGFQGGGCMGVGDTNPIAHSCDILHSPAACSFHNVTCAWSAEACVQKSSL
jgi:hypothetical protein